MNAAIDRFVSDMRADPRGLAAVADTLAQAYREIELEGVRNRDARQFLKAVDWIISAPRTLDERIEALEKLRALPGGPRIVSLKQLTGWK